MKNNYKLIWVVARITAFWWLILTIYSFIDRPLEFLSIWQMHFKFLKNNAFLIVIGSTLILVGIYALRELTRAKIRSNLKRHELMGMFSSIGSLPIVKSRFHNIKGSSIRKPVKGKYLNEWIKSQQKIIDINGKSCVEESVYLKLFFAIWDVYCENAHYPASHRNKGHGSRRLYLHCHDVAEHCLELINNGWKYDGVYVKRRMRKAIKILEPNAQQAELSLDDPLIPIVGLAHDIGKLLIYEVDDQGNIVKNKEEGSNTLDDDDVKVKHDVLAPVVLSQFPEFWQLNNNDRVALNMAVAQYHHPSSFPLDDNGLLLDERAAMLMMLLITSDRRVSAAEANIPLNMASDDLDQDSTSELYDAFVEIITEFGRINGTGDARKDKTFRIGQKHNEFIALNQKQLNPLLCKKMNLSEATGKDYYKLNNQLLNILMDKGLLYTEHNGVDFSDWLPLWRVSLFHHIKKQHMITFKPAILLKLPTGFKELESIGFLDTHPAIAVVDDIWDRHLATVKNKKLFNEKRAKAFVAEVVQENIDEIDDQAFADNKGPFNDAQTVADKKPERVEKKAHKKTQDLNLLEEIKKAKGEVQADAPRQLELIDDSTDSDKLKQLFKV